jgi:hypothetical protein
MCRDGHIQIGHQDSEHEQCPVCRLVSALESAREFIDGSDEAPRQRDRLLREIDFALFSVTNGHGETP